MKSLPIRFKSTVRPEEFKQAFAQNGYFILENFYTQKECQDLIDRMRCMIEECDIEALRTIFSTTDASHIQNEYFRYSGDKIRFFLEKNAIDSQGKLTKERYQSINKAGHALHDLDPVFSAFSRKPELATLTRNLGIITPLLLQSMYIFKPPDIGGEVCPHQDGSFLYTRPESVVGFWIALEDALQSNGCLQVAPGSHLLPLRQRLHYQNEELAFTQLDPTPLPELSVSLEAQQGDLIVLHGRLAHGSNPNVSAQSRQAYTLHVIDGCCEYGADNWLQRDKSMPLRGF